MNPYVSVVMPTFNRGYTIQNAIRSIIDQSYTNWELIIVDDGSEDNTESKVRMFREPKIVYKKLEHCGNVSQVRNIGNSLARGEIIVVQDSDDMSLPDRLEEIVKKFDETNADVVYHGMYMRGYDPYTECAVRQCRPALPYSKEHILKEQYIPGQIAYKKSVITKTPYDNRVRCCDDYQILLELALNDYKFEPIYKNIYEYNFSADSINVSGEQDGSRKRDVEIILNILEEKYNYKAHATLVKNTIDGTLITRETI
jgi:glycosyltransferase involved in cell wall biosynthesis